MSSRALYAFDLCWGGLPSLSAPPLTSIRSISVTTPHNSRVLGNNEGVVEGLIVGGLDDNAILEMIFTQFFRNFCYVLPDRHQLKKFCNSLQYLPYVWLLYAIFTELYCFAWFGSVRSEHRLCRCDNHSLYTNSLHTTLFFHITYNTVPVFHSLAML